MNEILTAQEVAAELRCSKAQVYELMNGEVKDRTRPAWISDEQVGGQVNLRKVRYLSSVQYRVMVYGIRGTFGIVSNVKSVTY